MCLFGDLRCSFMGSREIALVPSRDENYKNDVEQKQEVNFKHLLSTGTSKAMALSHQHCLSSCLTHLIAC